jgi:hypothetical protein
VRAIQREDIDLAVDVRHFAASLEDVAGTGQRAAPIVPRTCVQFRREAMVSEVRPEGGLARFDVGAVRLQNRGRGGAAG